MTQKKQIQQTTKSSLQPSTARNAEIINEYLKLRDRLRTVHSGQTVVCTIGSWDILHEGHVAYLKDAHELGDVLVVGVDSDEAYERYKRDTVFYPEDDRQAIVAALRYVDYVTLISDVDIHGEWGMELVRAIDPDVFVCNNKSYSLEQRKRLESLCSGVVRSLPFHDSLQSVIASVKLKRAGRASAERTALVATIVSFMMSLLAISVTILPALSRGLAHWSSIMRQDLPFLPTFTWAQFVGGLAVGLLSVIIAGLVGRATLKKR